MNEVRLPARPRRWWVRPVLVLLALGGSLTLPLLAAPPASATTLQATVLPPHDGTISSSPDEPHHTPYDGDYSFDVTGTSDAFARFRNANGGLSLTVASIGRACASGSFADGGDRITLNVFINGAKVGTVAYAHLTNFSYGVGAGVPVGGRLGRPVTTADGVNGSSCWTGPHVHVEPRNDVRYGCFFAGQLNHGANGGTPLGIIGAEYAGGKNVACPAGAEYNPPPTDPPGTANGGSQISNPHANRCMDANGAGTANGTQIQLWDCNGGAAQQWVYVYADKSLHIYGNYSKCLDADGATIAANGTKLQVWDCHGGTNQGWIPQADGTLRSAATGRCVDATGAGTANGTPIQLYDCNGGVAQTWVGTPRPNGGSTLIGVQSGRCLDVPGVGISPGLDIMLSDCHGGANQQWLVSGKTLQVYADKCLDADGGGTTNGQPVQIWYCHGGANQQWELRTDGTVRLPATGKCLDATGGGTANGTLLQVWDCNGSPQQKFTRPLSADKVAPTAAMTAPHGKTRRGHVAVAWSGSDTGSGIGHYELQLRSKRHGHKWSAWVTPSGWNKLVGTSLTSPKLHKRSKTCFSVRAVDKAGNVSAWSTPACITRRR